MPDRLAAITHAMTELNRCVENRGHVDPDARFGWTLGECDWLGELQRLLYEGDSE